jgi:parallel beta-helix repeat protein
VKVFDLAIDSFIGSGLVIRGSNVTVEQSDFGVKSDGFTPAGNVLDGITIAASSLGDIIGKPGFGNTISGNLRYGIGILGGHSNVIQNNIIGTDVSGVTAIPNGAGIALLSGAAGNNITTNVISGNTDAGVLLMGTTTTGNIVQGNEIGIFGNTTFANHDGILLAAGAHGNMIGNGNIISGNTDHGIKVDGPGTAPNAIQNNRAQCSKDGRSG